MSRKKGSGMSRVRLGVLAIIALQHFRGEEVEMAFPGVGEAQLPALWERNENIWLSYSLINSIGQPNQYKNMAVEAAVLSRSGLASTHFVQ